MIQHVKNLLAMQETQKTQVRSLGQEDPLEEEMAAYSSILAWKIPQTEEPGGLQSKELDIFFFSMAFQENLEITEKGMSTEGM